jgi:hypothetical protein
MKTKKKVGILTLPLHTNYGGNLQAYALMNILKGMGHDVSLIKRVPAPISILKQNYLLCKQLIKKYVLFRDERISFISYKEKKRRMGITRQHTDRFINGYITPQTDAYSSTELLANNIEKYQFDACIVGSDQVWRPRYAGALLPDFFFAFLKGNDKVKKISYAASFGTEDWEFSETQAEICGNLLKDFTAVSVREDIGVKLCEKKFGITARQALDPTLLLDKADYLKLIDDEKPNEKNELFVYLIDVTADKEDVIKKISTKFGYHEFRIGKISLRDEIAGLKEQPIAPSVGTWLKGFADAKFVITDSFHGCVFCILFNKPFVVYASKARGLSRFTSLLSMFGLEDRLIFSSDQLNDNLFENINWDKVGAVLKEKRADACQFLQDALS